MDNIINIWRLSLTMAYFVSLLFFFSSNRSWMEPCAQKGRHKQMLKHTEKSHQLLYYFSKTGLYNANLLLSLFCLKLRSRYSLSKEQIPCLSFTSLDSSATITHKLRALQQHQRAHRSPSRPNSAGDFGMPV